MDEAKGWDKVRERARGRRADYGKCSGGPPPYKGCGNGRTPVLRQVCNLMYHKGLKGGSSRPREPLGGVPVVENHPNKLASTAFKADIFA